MRPYRWDPRPWRHPIGANYDSPRYIPEEFESEPHAPWPMDHAIDRYVGEKKLEGKLANSSREAKVREVLGAHCKDVDAADPETTTPDQVSKTFSRWEGPALKSNGDILVRFYDWAYKCGVRSDNPARLARGDTRKLKRPASAEQWATPSAGASVDLPEDLEDALLYVRGLADELDPDFSRAAAVFVGRLALERPLLLDDVPRIASLVATLPDASESVTWILRDLMSDRYAVART